MYDLSQVLDVPVSFFYDEMPEDVKNRNAIGETEVSGGVLGDKHPLTRRETLELVSTYHKLNSLLVRKRVFELVKSLAKAQAGKVQSDYTHKSTIIAYFFPGRLGLKPLKSP